MTAMDVGWVRHQFPGLSHFQRGSPVAFFDGPAGSQVPRSVADAVSRYLLDTNSQHGGVFEVSRASDSILNSGHQALHAIQGQGERESSRRRGHEAGRLRHDL